MVSKNQARALFKFGGNLGSTIEELTEEEQYYIGRAVSANILSNYKTYNNRALNRYANKIALLLSMNSSKPETFAGYKVQIIDSHEINAMAAPGGFIFFTTGFLKILDDEDELAALIAHEIAHITENHGINAIKEANLAESLIELGKASTPSEYKQISRKVTKSFGNSVEDILTTLLTKGYSRQQEYTADEEALSILSKSGYEPSSILDLMEKLKKNSYSSTAGGWDSTHPESDDRIENISSKVQKQADSDNKNRTIRSKRFSGITRRL